MTDELPEPSVLPECALLAGFEEQDRHALTTHGRFISFKSGEVVIRESEKQECLYLLISGSLRAVHNVDGGKTPLGSIESGEWFGEINIFDPNTASAMVVAHMDSQAWYITRAQLEEFLNERPQLGCQLLLGVGEVLARRTRDLTVKLNASWEISW